MPFRPSKPPKIATTTAVEATVEAQEKKVVPFKTQDWEKEEEEESTKTPPPQQQKEKEKNNAN